MTTYFSPGVYVQEVDSGPKPIAGVPTSVAALIGRTEKGPVQDPTRLTSWNDYLATFGGAIAGSYTAEAALGFFQNGGQALWVTRADNASLSTWMAIDGTGADAFAIEAHSPGAWSKDTTISVARSLEPGQGELFRANITGPNSLGLTAGSSVALSVDNATGAHPNMAVQVDDTTNGAPVRGTITSVSGNTITVTAVAPGRTIALADGPRLSARIVDGAGTLDLQVGSGFQAGDVILAVPATGEPEGAAVQAITPVGTGTRLTLDTPFDDDVPGEVFAQRTLAVAVGVQAAGAGADAKVVGDSRLANLPAGVTAADFVRLTLAGGLSIAAGAANTFTFGSDVAAGPASLTVRAKVTPFQESVALTIDPGATAAAIDTLLGRFTFVPAGARLTLTRTAPAGQVEFTRTDTGWTAPATPEGTYTAAEMTPRAADAARGIVVRASLEPEVGDHVEFAANNRQAVTEVRHPPGTPDGVYVLVFDTFATNPAGSSWPLLAWQPTAVMAQRFDLTAALTAPGAPAVAETFSGLSLNPTHPRYYLAAINDASRLIRVQDRTAATPVSSPAAFPIGVRAGTPGALGELTLAGVRTALLHLERTSEPALLAAPDVLTLPDTLSQSAAYGELIIHAETFRRFAVVDLPSIDDDKDLLDWRMLHLDSTYAAAYAPFVRVLNPRPGPGARTLDVPPSGFVMGVYARTDTDRGVWKAPANERVNGIVGLAREYTQRRQDLLNPRGVNLLRPFLGRGTRVWGARNVTDDTTWRYVNVRRLFLFIENSIDSGTQWVVFEPNTATTWLRVRVSVEDFLNQVWRAGGLAGATPEQAYRVRCGLGTTMTEADIELGLLLIEVAVAPAYPAEFVVFRISHKRQAE